MSVCSFLNAKTHSVWMALYNLLYNSRLNSVECWYTLNSYGTFHSLYHFTGLCLRVPDRLCVSGGDFSVTLAAGYVDMPVGWQQVTVFMSDQVNHSFNHFIQNAGSYQKSDSLMDNSLNHLLNLLAQKTDSFRNEKNDWLICPKLHYSE